MRAKGCFSPLAGLANPTAPYIPILRFVSLATNLLHVQFICNIAYTHLWGYCLLVRTMFLNLGQPYGGGWAGQPPKTKRPAFVGRGVGYYAWVGGYAGCWALQRACTQRWAACWLGCQLTAIPPAMGLPGWLYTQAHHGVLGNGL